MDTKNNPIISIGLADQLLVVFIVLKLTGVIAWSWWWVLSPLWIPVAIFTIVVVIAAIFMKDD